MTALTREYSHPYSLGNAHDLDDLQNDPEGFASKVIPLAEALPHWERITLCAKHAALVKNGHRLPARDVGDIQEPGARAMFLDPDGAALALVESIDRDGEAHWAVLRGLWS